MENRATTRVCSKNEKVNNDDEDDKDNKGITIMIGTGHWPSWRSIEEWPTATTTPTDLVGGPH